MFILNKCELTFTLLIDLVYICRMESKVIDRRTLSDNKIGIVGAKKKADTERVIPVLVYIKQGHVNDIGGVEKAREIAKNAINKTKKVK
jgi:hypothetical protein